MEAGESSTGAARRTAATLILPTSIFAPEPAVSRDVDSIHFLR